MASVQHIVKHIFEGYSKEYTPLGSYSALLAVYMGLLTAVPLVAKKRGRFLTEDFRLRDLLLLTPATHKISRIVTKDWVTSPVRAPFTTFVENTGAGEVSEKPRGSGMRKALGDLLTCQYCIGPWVAGSLVLGLSYSPTATRNIAVIFGLVAASDFLHLAYQAVKPQASNTAEISKPSKQVA